MTVKALVSLSWIIAFRMFTHDSSDSCNHTVGDDQVPAKSAVSFLLLLFVPYPLMGPLHPTRHGVVPS